MKISVALCTYNGARYIEEQLESLAAQTLLPDELILCDDGSTDGTVELARNFSLRAPFKVSVSKNENRLGVTGNFERAISLCTGEVIFLCDQDDYWLPGKLLQMATLFRNNNDTGLIFSDATIVDKELAPLGYTMWNTIQFNKRLQAQLNGDNALTVLGNRYVVTGATLAFRRSLMRDIIPIPANFFHDAWISVIAAAKSRVSSIDTPLILYRQHDANTIGGMKNGYFRSVMDAINRPLSWFQSEIARIRVLTERLKSISGPDQNIRGILFLEGKIEHLEKRREIFVSSIFKRFILSTEELFSLRYFIYSEGLASFFIDVFFRSSRKSAL